jgi:hypothetical protein
MRFIICYLLLVVCYGDYVEEFNTGGTSGYHGKKKMHTEF